MVTIPQLVMLGGMLASLLLSWIFADRYSHAVFGDHPNIARFLWGGVMIIFFVLSLTFASWVTRI